MGFHPTLTNKLFTDDTLVEVYPLLKSYHDLSPGKYMIYLFYAFNGCVIQTPSISYFWDANKPKDNQIFKGVIFSNKVPLIVK